MAEERPGPARSAMLMVATRIVNMGVGLLTLPVLIRYLGGERFAAWAILLALAAGFSLLELGMPPMVVRFLAVPARDGDWPEARRLIARSWVLLAASFLLGAFVTWIVAPLLVRWTGLPDMALFDAAHAVYFVFGAVAMRAFLQTGVLSLYAARRFVAVASFALVQPLCSNIAAMLAAWMTGRLDLALIAYWTAQTTVLLAGFVATRRLCLPLFGRGTFDFTRLRELLRFGVASQMEGWAQFVNFQFDKFLVAGLVGLWGVAPYEVANRAMAALRSAPASGAETFLPTAMVQRESRADAWAWYEASTRMMAAGVCVFVIAPLAVSPLFLYAWTGEMGYVGRWVFVALAAGTAASLLALPAATLAQAEGWPALQGRAALLSVCVNVPLSYLLVTRWELVGAAIGTAVAMVIGAAQLVHALHRRFGRPLRGTLRALGAFWPAVLPCAALGVATFVLFDLWFASVDPALRFSRTTRIYPGLVAVAAYFACVAAMAAGSLRCGVFSVRERQLAAAALRIRWRPASTAR